MDIERFLANYILRPIVQLVRLVFWPVLEVLGRIIARTDENRLEKDVRAELSFLFVKHRGSFVPNKDVPYPPSFDYAFATVATDSIIIRFCRGRGEIDIRIASASAPQDWYELHTILVALDEKTLSEPQGELDMHGAARLLESNMSLITKVFGENDSAFYKRLADVRINERIQIKEAEWQLNKRY